MRGSLSAVLQRGGFDFSQPVGRNGTSHPDQRIRFETRHKPEPLHPGGKRVTAEPLEGAGEMVRYLPPVESRRTSLGMEAMFAFQHLCKENLCSLAAAACRGWAMSCPGSRRVRR